MPKKEKTEKLTQIESVQSWSPIRDVERGIIVTKDNRFIKLMELSPINFGLRSASEQTMIANAFGAAMRSLPKSFQFKVTSRRADVTQFIDDLAEHKMREPSASCRKMQMQQMEMIRHAGATEGVSRRFFVAFPYEERAYTTRKLTFEDVYYDLDRVANTFEAGLRPCGNEVISENTNEYTLSALYSIFARSESEKKSFEERETDVMARYAAANDRSMAQTPIIPVNDFICPAKMDTKLDSRYIKVDDTYYMFAYIEGNSYPSRVVAGWLQLLINLYEGIDVDMFVRKEDPESTQRKLQYKIRFNKIRVRESEDTDTGYDDLAASVGSGYYLKEGLASGDDFCYFCTLLTITAHSKEELNWKWDEVKNICVRNDLKIRQCVYEQEQAFRSALPICSPDPGIFRKGRRNALLSDLASIYPFVSFEMTDPGGIMMGVNSGNGSLVFVNIFDRKKYPNGNVTILGSTGAGKTYTLLLMALRMRQKNNQVFIIAPYKGEEFYRACKEIGGQFIRIAPGSSQTINIMEIRKTETSEEDVVIGNLAGKESVLAKKIQQLHVFFSLLVPDMDAEERQLLDEAMVKTYAKFGITSRNKTLIDPRDGVSYKKMPVLSDLHQTLAEFGEKTARIYNCLSRYVNGSAASFSKQTNVSLTNKFIVLDVSTLTEEMLPMGMFMALDFAWDTIKSDRTKQKVVFLDELWRLIGPGSSPKAAEFVLEIFKLIRSYNGCAVGATQDLNDFFAQDDGRYGKAIVNNAKIKLLMKMEPREAEVVAETMDLTQNERDEIKKIQKGTCLLVANTNHVFMQVKASNYEHDLITTSADDLRRIAAQRNGAAQ